jgi:hypothetical protein
MPKDGLGPLGETGVLGDRPAETQRGLPEALGDTPLGKVEGAPDLPQGRPS